MVILLVSIGLLCALGAAYKAKTRKLFEKDFMHFSSLYFLLFATGSAVAGLCKISIGLYIFRIVPLLFSPFEEDIWFIAAIYLGISAVTLIIYFVQIMQNHPLSK